MEEKKEILKIFSGEQSLIPSTPRQLEINITEKILELFVNALPRMAEAFRSPQIKEVVTLRVFIDEYLYLIKNNRSASYHESVQLSFKHLTSFFDTQKPINSIKLKEIEDFLVHLQQKIRKGYVVYFRNLKAAFNKARDWGYVSENLFTKVKLPKKQKNAPVFINSEQLTEICEQMKNEIVKNVVVFAFYTGMRLDEIVNLRWKNVDLQNRVIIVGDEQFTTKGRNQRFIPMSEEAIKAIENAKLRIRQKDGGQVHNEKQKMKQKIHLITDVSDSIRLKDEFVFCKSNGVRYTDDHYSKGFKNACKTAGMDSAIHFHSLRHSFASNLVQKGVPLYTIKELLGHSSISTTEIYTHLNMESLREAVEKLDTSAVRQSSPHALLSAGSRYEGQGTKEDVKEHNKTIKHEVKIYRINAGEKR